MKAELISHMGSDLSVVNAARVSFLGESQELTDKDAKLIHYLKEHQHDSPFEHCTATFKISRRIHISNYIHGLKSREIWQPEYAYSNAIMTESLEEQNAPIVV